LVRAVKGGKKSGGLGHGLVIFRWWIGIGDDACSNVEPGATAFDES